MTQTANSGTTSRPSGSTAANVVPRRLRPMAGCSRLRRCNSAFPFDPRREVSADAKHISGRIVTHLWVIFVLLPIVLGILWAIVK
jgi:hypothetical protein